MCGIFFSARFSSPNCELVAQDQDVFSTISLELRKINAARGPDAQKTHRMSLTSLSGAKDTAPRILELEFYASELRLRGQFPVVQPHIQSGNIFCWNGEIFEGMEISNQENDGCKIFDVLCTLQTPEQIRDLFGSIEGPYAFVFYHRASSRLYFGRDPLGRRSLLIHKPSMEAPYLLLSSVSAGANPAYDFSELSTEHVYSLDVTLLKDSLSMENGFHSFFTGINRELAVPRHLSSFSKPGMVNTTIPPDDAPMLESLDHIPDHLLQAVDDLVTNLDLSVMLHVRDIPDTTKGKARVAILFSGGIDSTILTFFAHRHIPIDEPIDLLNVAFENPRKIKIQKEGNPGSVPKRIRKFQPHREEFVKETSEKVSYLVPDRATGLKELEELRHVCPGRVWNFVEINVPYIESQAARSTVESLMAPGRTVMDMSLALALYFASRGIGQIKVNPNADPQPYTSEARVVISGLGSDELLGGYGRHRSVFQAGGWPAVISELQEEIDRIPTRNLGRDDRVISSHGKETRHPFLSLSVVSFLSALPVHFKMDPRVEVGVGDKMLLRLAARKLGLIEASSQKKRAMQFGSHSARMERERRGDVELE